MIVYKCDVCKKKFWGKDLYQINFSVQKPEFMTVIRKGENHICKKCLNEKLNIDIDVKQKESLSKGTWQEKAADTLMELLTDLGVMFEE